MENRSPQGAQRITGDWGWWVNLGISFYARHPEHSRTSGGARDLPAQGRLKGDPSARW